MAGRKKKTAEEAVFFLRLRFLGSHLATEAVPRCLGALVGKSRFRVMLTPVATRFFVLGAEGGTRTHTGKTPRTFEALVSANSTTSAGQVKGKHQFRQGS